METLVERGVSYADCCQRIVQKYGIYFKKLRTTEGRSPGFLGLGRQKWVEVEFYLTSPPWKMAAGGAPPAQGDPAEEQAQYAGPRKGDGTLDFVERKKRVLAAAGKDPDQVFQKVQEEKEAERLILEKLQKIEEKIEERIETSKSEAKAEHPALLQIAELLRLNDFSERYTAGILEKARGELSLQTLEDLDAVQSRVLAWIAESIKIFHIPHRPKSGRIMILVGPTGVGKTTTIAKLAAVYGIENSGRRPLSVRMITIDAFRIGAGKQIEAYGDIMEIPVSYIDNHRDLRRELDLYRDETDLFLIDTIGRSPKDSSKLGEMKELLDACGPKAEIHLALSASTKTSDMEHILQQFEPFNYQAVMLTKLDETRHIGNVISALAERGKALSYVTDGQIVPKDIKRASVIRFLINLEDFRVDRDKFEQLFPSTEADQFQWGYEDRG